MNRLGIGIIMCAVLGVSACSQDANPQTQVTPDNTQVAARTTARVVAEGRVVPATSAALSFSTGGIISDVPLAEGSRVEVNQVVARLDARRQTAVVAQADATLRRAKSRLDLLTAGARTQEVETARAALDAAQAQLARLEQGARPEDIAAASANVAIAQAQLLQAQEGASPLQIEAAAADLANAEAALRQRQADYDRVAAEPGAGARPEALALEQATNAYRVAKARYDDVVKGPSASSIALARARVQQALAQLDAVKAPARQAEMDSAKADIRRAQAQLDLVQAGARSEDIVAAQTDVDSAQAALEQASILLGDTELRSPIAGVLASLSVKEGEQAAPGVIVARVGDTSVWEIETTDLTELNVINLKVGTRATITVDALPDTELAGKVARIRSYGENRQGDIVYAVTVQLDSQVEQLRWNMTASVTFEP